MRLLCLAQHRNTNPAWVVRSTRSTKINEISGRIIDEMMTETREEIPTSYMPCRRTNKRRRDSVLQYRECSSSRTRADYHQILQSSRRGHQKARCCRMVSILVGLRYIHKRAGQPDQAGTTLLLGMPGMCPHKKGQKDQQPASHGITILHDDAT